MKYVVLAHQVHTFPNEPPEVAWFEAKLGAEPFMVIPMNEGLAIVANGPLEGVDMQFPLIITTAGSPYEMSIGEKPGAFIGVTNMREPKTGKPMQAFVYRGPRWPATVTEGRTALQDATTAGRA